MEPLFLGTIASFGLIILRWIVIADNFYFFLPYNLILAFIPLVLSWLIVRYNKQKHRSLLLLGASWLVWLVFFPNAPYIITDLVHLVPYPGVSIWYDLLLILSFASTGLLAGWYSLHQLQTLVAKHFGKSTSWTFVVAVLVLSSFGVYVGHFLRWNSWDLFLDPINLGTDVMLRFSDFHNHFWIVTGFLFSFFIVSYTSLYHFLKQR